MELCQMQRISKLISLLLPLKLLGVALLLYWSGELCGQQTIAGQQTASPNPSRPETQSIGDTDQTDSETPKQSVDSRSVTVRFPHDGATYIGRLLARSGNTVVLQRRDGDLKYLEIPADKKIEILSSTFEPHSPESLKVQLQEEFGSRYEVSTTDRCVVVHPIGESEYWANPFEAFIDNFEYYFEQFDYELADAPFPYVVIVLRSRSDFDRHMRAEVKITNRNVTGFYSVHSNRMVTYDPLGKVRIPSEKRRSWLYDSQTVLHESAHQLAFNRGIHNRLAPPPLWLSEGFATLFEARGFNQARDFGSLKERANRPRLTRLRNLYRGERIEGKLAKLLTDDRLFQTDTELAYTLAWGVTFYLSEKKPEKFREYLRADAGRTNFRTQPTNERVELFVNHFGSDIKQLEAEMKEFYVEK